MWPWSENTGVPKPTQNNLPESKHCSAKTFGWFPVGEPDILSEINSNSLSKCPDGQVEEVNNRKFLNTITGNNVANTFPKEQEFYNHTGKDYSLMVTILTKLKVIVFQETMLH